MKAAVGEICVDQREKQHNQTWAAAMWELPVCATKRLVVQAALLAKCVRDVWKAPTPGLAAN